MQLFRRIVFCLAPTAVVALSLVPFSAAQNHYTQTNLVSDIPGVAAQPADANLVNPWGLTRTAASTWWVNNAGSGNATLFDAAGNKQTLVVTIPGPGAAKSTPTGNVANNTVGFLVNGTQSRFIFVTLDGTIAAWNASLGATAQTTVPNTTGAAYTGVALGLLGDSPMLYAANFVGGRVDVFNGAWQPATVPGGFADTSIPPGYAPFNVQNIGGNIFVMFARQTIPPEFGKGLGFVDEFDTAGNLLMRLQAGPWMNAPWAITLAPSNFGELSDRLLVGEFGSGQIAAFDSHSGEFEGLMHGSRGPIAIDRLWSLQFGSGATANGPNNTLFFAAGIGAELHGLFGTLTAAQNGSERHLGRQQ
jgi:uncharacterized protein (TIGR03118 family)